MLKISKMINPLMNIVGFLLMKGEIRDSFGECDWMREVLDEREKTKGFC